MAHPNMKRVELKRIVEFLWKGSPADEKTPFAAQGVLPDNGSVKSLEAGDNKKALKEFPEDEVENMDQPMSIARKVCFAMSFNAWILYFLVFIWLLPCRHQNCGLPYPKTMERNLSDIRPLTDLEPMNEKGLPSLAMLGYMEGKEFKLAALATYDATLEWNISLPFIPDKIQCNFENVFDANDDGIQDCLLSGFEDVYAFNASNGHVFWHSRLPSMENAILSGFHPTTDHHNQVNLIGTYGDKLVVLSAKTGNRTTETVLPCSSPISIRIVVGPVNSSVNVTTNVNSSANVTSNVNSSTNITTWSLVCFYGDKIEAWGFDERDVLRRGNLENNSTEFTLLFSGIYSGRSIDLRRDVTTVPGGPLLLSLANRVSMVTRETTAWEKYIPYPFSVAGIAVFRGIFSYDVAAAVNNKSDTIVTFMQLNYGINTRSVILPNRHALSIETVPGDEDDDSLLLKSVILGNSTRHSHDFFDAESDDQINFVLISMRNPVQVKEIANVTSVLKTSVNIQTNGETDLLVLKAENGTTTYVRHLIHGSKSLNPMCHSAFEL